MFALTLGLCRGTLGSKGYPQWPFPATLFSPLSILKQDTEKNMHVGRGLIENMATCEAWQAVPFFIRRDNVVRMCGGEKMGARRPPPER